MVAAGLLDGGLQIAAPVEPDLLSPDEEDPAPRGLERSTHDLGRGPPEGREGPVLGLVWLAEGILDRDARPLLTIFSLKDPRGLLELRDVGGLAGERAVELDRALEGPLGLLEHALLERPVAEAELVLGVVLANAELAQLEGDRLGDAAPGARRRALGRVDLEPLLVAVDEDGAAQGEALGELDVHGRLAGLRPGPLQLGAQGLGQGTLLGANPGPERLDPLATGGGLLLGRRGPLRRLLHRRLGTLERDQDLADRVVEARPGDRVAILGLEGLQLLGRSQRVLK